MIEPEISFADLTDCMDLAEDFLKFLIKYCLQNNKADLEFFSERIKKGNIDYIRGILEQRFQRIDYAEACEKL
jgi:asparaginyl-tRNA synthetase